VTLQASQLRLHWQKLCLEWWLTDRQFHWARILVSYNSND